MDDCAPIESVEVRAYTVPTDAPESDGTLEWHATTLVVAHVAAAGRRGLGYSYADRATATLIRDKLGPMLLGRDALDISARWVELVRAVRNLGRAGIASMAISALDVALWDLKAKHLGVSLGLLLAPARRAIRA
jgi:L-alanine-DL-glutamate epimerase-like enolase superfamily enzyme